MLRGGREIPPLFSVKECQMERLTLVLPDPAWERQAEDYRQAYLESFADIWQIIMVDLIL